MKRSMLIAGCLVVAMQVTVAGQDYEITPTPEPALAPPSSTSSYSTPPGMEMFSPDLPGAEASVPSYTLPTHYYSGWYRPRAIGRGIAVRCGTDSWRPRGFGRLFAEPCNMRRMDYRPYGVADWGTEYGPAYYRLAPDQRCANCDHYPSGAARPECQMCGQGACCGMAGCGLGGGLGWGLFAGSCAKASCGEQVVEGCHDVKTSRRRKVHHITRR